MEKKRYWFLLLGSLLFLPVASAQGFDSFFYDVLGFGYYGDWGFAVMKVAIFVLLFTFLHKGTSRMFPENRVSATLVALVIAVMADVFIPTDFVENLGSASGIAGVLVITLALLALPFMVMSALNITAALGRWKWTCYGVLILAEIFAIYYFVGNAAYESQFFSSVLLYFQDYIEFFFGGALVLLGLGVLISLSRPRGAAPAANP